MANCLVLTKVDADLALSAERSTAQGPYRAAHLHPSGVAAGHEPLTMEPPGTAVRTAVSPGHARPSGPTLSVLFRRGYALSSRLSSHGSKRGPGRDSVPAR